MATYSRILLSSSSNGMPIPITATSSPGTQIHQAIIGTTSYDEIYLWASNVTSSPATITIQFGGITEPGNDIVLGYTLPANSPPIPLVTGQVLQNGLICRAYSGTTNAINVAGYVNRIV